jgi:chorismate dehydratase
LTGKYKIGCVPFLNAEPLIWPLENGQIQHGFEIVREVPSKLVRKIGAGELDCALASSVALLDFPNLIPIPNIAISSRGAAASVLLFHNDPIGELDTIWLDPASRTSNVLVQILRDRSSHIECNFINPESETPPEIDSLPEKTGRLLIGDKALEVSNGPDAFTNFTDLGELWKEKTGQSMTFARWFAKSGDIAAELLPILSQARDWSLVHLPTFIDKLSIKYGFPTELVDRYLRNNICYMYGPREQAGERQFMTEAKNLLARKDIG